jgi:hypothetical protein
MDDYFEHFNLFYDQKLKFLSKKQTQCKACGTQKKFIEKNNQLILSCGNGNDGGCGVLFKITLPIYIHKTNEIEKLKKNINDTPNFETLNKYNLITKEEYNTYKENYEGNLKGIEIIEEQYKINNINGKAEQIKELYNKRETLLSESKIIMGKINEATENKGDLRKKYVSLIKEINDINGNLRLILDEPHILRGESVSLVHTLGVNQFIQIQKPTIEIINKDYKNILRNTKAKTTDKSQPKPKPKPKPKDSPDTEPKSGKLTIDDFEEGMNVEWIHYGKKMTGRVNKINKRKKKKINIIWANSDIKDVDISKLKIIKSD